MADTIVSGMRPTGLLHIGHLEGVLSQWVKLQQTTNSFYFVADWHALTTETNTSNIRKHTIDMVKDWLAYGIDPQKSTIFLQSQVSQQAELSTIFSMIVNLGRLERLPSFNDYILDLQKNENGKRSYDEQKRSGISYGFLGYPVLQAADILTYKASKVPVGEDQLPHLELTRELARRFNKRYGQIFPEPEPIIGPASRVLGVDGRKMSKSYNNTINPTDETDTLLEKVRKIKSDTNKTRKDASGNPSDCQVFDLHDLYSNNKNSVGSECKEGQRGCFDCKKELVQNIHETYRFFRSNRNQISDGDVISILKQGSKAAQQIAYGTLEETKYTMKLTHW